MVPDDVSHRPLARALATLVCLAAAAAPAAAAGPDDAEALIKQGNDLRRSGDDQGALPLLARAYQAQPGPRTAVQLGLVEEALGRWQRLSTWRKAAAVGAFGVGTFGLGFTLGGLVFGKWRKA